MDDGDRREVLALRAATAYPVLFLGLTLLTRFSNAVYWSGLAGGLVLAVLFVLPLLYAIPRGRPWWARHRGWLLLLQAVLTYAPLAAFGAHWINIAPALLAGLLLLTVTAPRSWMLFSAVIVAEAVRIAVLGVPWPGPKGAIITWMLVAPVATGLAFFGLVRLTDMVAALHAARNQLADTAVAQERRRAADRLRTAIGDNLQTVVVHAKAALAALQTSPERARAQLVEASGIARRALERVRTAAPAEPPASWPSDHGSGQSFGLARAKIAPQLARFTLAVVLCGQVAILLSNILVAGGSPVAMAAAMVTIAVLVVLQLHHSIGRQTAGRPRCWKASLPIQAVLPFAWLPAYDWNILALAGFPAGSALLLLPRRWAWPVFGVIVGGVGLAWSLPVLGLYHGIGNRSVYTVAADNATVLYQVGAVATAGIVVYGLSRLTDLAEAVEAVRRELASSAVERERVRVAQDTHDFLGLGLSAVALKCDLATRLIGRDNARARDELEALMRLAEQGHTDIRSVATGTSDTSLRLELDAARDALSSAGVEVDIRTPGTGESLPVSVDAMLATVLREAVTNVLRHANARSCDIEVTVGDGVASLRVANDGVRDDAPRKADDEQARTGGHGLANLSARAAAAGGQVSTRAEGGRFELTVRAPLANTD